MVLFFKLVLNIIYKYLISFQLLIDDVILVNMFSRGGAQQIQFDVKRNILPLFAQFTPKPEVYFKS